MTDLIWLALFALISLAGEGYSIWKLIDYARLKKHGIPCHAKVVRLKKQYSGHMLGTDGYHPVLKFTTREGLPVEVHSSSGMTFRSGRFARGRKVQILYDAAQPHHWILVPNDLYIRIGIFLIWTLLLAGSGVIFTDTLMDGM